MDALKARIRHVPDFPKPGILFYDVTTLLRDPEGFKLAMAAPGGGKIYFTTNGIDPRVAFTGAVAIQAMTYSNPVILPVPAILKARVMRAGSWSALSEAPFAKAASQ